MRRQRGFTLVELITVIVVLGVLSIGSANFVRSAMGIFTDVNDRQQLLMQSRFALERMKRELRNAAPNSFRISGNGAMHCLQFVPVDWSTVYTSLPAAGSSADVDVMAMHDIDNNPYVISSGTRALVYPVRPEDIYQSGSGRIQTVTSCSDDGADNACHTLDDSDGIVQLDVADGFATTSPASRLYLVSQAVSFCVTNNRLVRFTSAISDTQPLAPVSADVLAANLVNTLSASPATVAGNDDPFQVYAANLQRNASVQLRLRFSINEEPLNYLQEVHSNNVP